MKKIIIAAVVVAAAFGIYSNSQKENTLSEIMMENIEALAEEEDDNSTITCCTDRSECRGDFCGVFYPANGSGVGYSVFYK